MKDAWKINAKLVKKKRDVLNKKTIFGKFRQKTIIKYRPIVAVNIGHYEDDFINVPLELKDKLIDYLFFFRMHSFQGNDSIFYAIPKERFCEYEF